MAVLIPVSRVAESMRALCTSHSPFGSVRGLDKVLAGVCRFVCMVKRWRSQRKSHTQACMPVTTHYAGMFSHLATHGLASFIAALEPVLEGLFTVCVST